MYISEMELSQRISDVAAKTTVGTHDLQLNKLSNHRDEEIFRIASSTPFKKKLIIMLQFYAYIKSTVTSSLTKTS
jgi:hypothetical protein